MSKQFSVGTYVKDLETGERGRVVYIYSDPRLRREIVAVRFDGTADAVAVPTDTLVRVSRPREVRSRLLLQLCIAIFVLVIAAAAQAADAKLTLACRGTVEFETGEKQQVALGIIIKGGAVYGLDTVGAVTGVTEGVITFTGSRGTSFMTGDIDRVTGEVTAISMLRNAKTDNLIISTSYVLICRPAQRIF